MFFSHFRLARAGCLRLVGGDGGFSSLLLGGGDASSSSLSGGVFLLTSDGGGLGGSGSGLLFDGPGFRAAVLFLLSLARNCRAFGGGADPSGGSSLFWRSSIMRLGGRAAIIRRGGTVLVTGLEGATTEGARGRAAGAAVGNDGRACLGASL